MKKRVKYGVCHYHLCRKRTRVYRCKFCGYYFCKEHIEPKPPSIPFFRIRTPEDALKLEQWRETGHPDVKFGEYVKQQEKERLEKSWKALDALKKVPIEPSEPEPYDDSYLRHGKKWGKEDYSDVAYKEYTKPKSYRPYIPEKKRFKIPIKLIAMIIILAFTGWYLYSNPEVIQNFKEKISDFFNTTFNATRVNETTEIQEVKPMVIDIPYILDYPEYKIYFPAEYRGRVKEGLLGSPIQEMLAEGWKIEYKDVPGHATTSQKITVNLTIKGEEQTKVIKQTRSAEINIKSLELQIHDLINVERRKNGLTSLEWDEKLAFIARGHSQDMINRNYFDHISPEGCDPTCRYLKNNYFCHIDLPGGYYIEGGAENIGLTPIGNVIGCGYVYSLYEIADCTVSGWMSSPGHRENILTEYWRKEGIGVAISDDNEFYITQNFC